ncbi:hypothetical protein Daus18300_010371 [Diaporthe australafricana]|uniref:Uncharacterized protein n=1 Tax=Diaporthe australafricana TaxID=127596 RepID=A0ABR3WAK7_9PEZI
MNQDLAAWQGSASPAHSSSRHQQQQAPSDELEIESPPPPYTPPKIQPAQPKMSDHSSNKQSSSDNMSSSSSGDGSAAGDVPLLSQPWQPKPRAMPPSPTTPMSSIRSRAAADEPYAPEPAMSTSPDPWASNNGGACC